MNGNVAKKLSKLEVKSTTIRGNFSTFSSRICNTEKSCKNVFWKTSHDYFSQYWPLHCKLTSLPYKSERKIEFGGQLRSGIANTDLNSLDHISRKSREQTLRCDVTAHEVPNLTPKVTLLQCLPISRRVQIFDVNTMKSIRKDDLYALYQS